MRVPQVTERIKEAPVVVLRGMLAGIGQVLLITDKLRNKTAPEDEPAGPAPAQTAPGAEATAEPEAQASAAADVQAGATAEAEASAEPTAETDVAVEADGGSLPLDNYDQLTVP